MNAIFTIYANAMVAYAIAMNVAFVAASVALVTPPKREEK
jgi:hypothetical protein